MKDPLKHRRKISTVIITLVILSMGCLCLPADILTTPVPPSQVLVPTTTLQPSLESPTNMPTGLASLGAWLLIDTDQGLWAADADGSNLTQLTQIDYWDWNLENAVQPYGNLVAYLSPEGYDLHNMALNLLSLPDGTTTKLTDLTIPETEAYVDLAPGEPGFEALRAVRDKYNFVWSPDGTRLAFVGLMDGPSAEIYIYDTISRQIQRVSNDGTQNYWPCWSPDGNYLLFLGADGFGNGAGSDTTGVWLTNGDGTNVTSLYEPAGGSEIPVGWLNDTTVVFATSTPELTYTRLRSINVLTSETTIINEGWLMGAEADDVRGAVIYANERGLFVYSNDNPTSVLVSEDEVIGIEPVEWGEYYFTVQFNFGYLATFGTDEADHQVSPVTPFGRQEVAMYAWIWAWTSEADDLPGVWITGPGFEFGQIFDQPARLPIWDEENNLLFFSANNSGGYDLYRTTFNAFFNDLTRVGSINGEAKAVTWLGRRR